MASAVCVELPFAALAWLELVAWVPRNHVRTTKLLGYYAMYGAIVIETDLSGHATNGTLTGTTVVNHPWMIQPPK